LVVKDAQAGWPGQQHHMQPADGAVAPVAMVVTASSILSRSNVRPPLSMASAARTACLALKHLAVQIAATNDFYVLAALESEATQTLGKKVPTREQPDVGVGVLKPPPPHRVATMTTQPRPVPPQWQKLRRS
jgi:hypothetical protein